MPTKQDTEQLIAPRSDFLACPVDSYSFEVAAHEIVDRAANQDMTTVVHFLNVGKIVKATAEPLLMAALWDGDLVLADGKPLVPLGRALGIRLPGRVNGTDLMERVTTLCEERGLSVYLLGATQHTVEKAVDNLLAKHSGQIVAGFRNGYFMEEDVPAIIAAINASGASILFVGIPSPQKELFAFINRSALRVSVIQGVGGSFDVLAGVVERAPHWMQRVGLEWLWRVLQEPRRLLWRYTWTNTLFLLQYTVAVIGHVLGKAAPSRRRASS